MKEAVLNKLTEVLTSMQFTPRRDIKTATVAEWKSILDEVRALVRDHLIEQPPIKPWDWVKFRDTLNSDLAGKIRRVRAITGSYDPTEEADGVAKKIATFTLTMRVHLMDGRARPLEEVERLATTDEILIAEGRAK